MSARLGAVFLFGLLTASPAFANLGATPQSGPWVEIGVGGSGLAYPTFPHAAGSVSTGWWFGKYDDAYSLGRFFGAGVTLQGGLGKGFTVAQPMLELRRGMDLLVVAMHGFVAAGPIWAFIPDFPDSSPGVAAQIGAVAKYRRHRYWHIGARLAAGVVVNDGKVGSDLSFQIIGAWMRPVGKREKIK